MEKFLHILGILFWGGLPLIGICYLIAPDRVSSLLNIYKYIFLAATGGGILCLILIAFILFLVEKWQKEAQQSNKIVATISILAFIIVCITFTIISGNADVPFADSFRK